ncbi:hypothetical protein [Labilibaculum euxinus]|uniref:Uncharacterized protein n=1 Tax=Labilibaculum euxinus TaxID=2686357 RepID=A0A7M4D2D0_9BACT|nr:hypothetical protein [Labilibaculum euxinus]MUP36809.1 hypothetical protein [Labilibaculum euxinus]MVB06014.1 hypothetical protein [Labilibaculum euxinus]
MILTTQQIRQLNNITTNALNQLYGNDLDLVSRGGMERSLSFRFGLYFHNLITDNDWLSDFNIDLEYNKNGNDTKRTMRRPRGVQPDFTLHRRGNNDENILIIEFKGYWDRRNRQFDRSKVEDFVNQNATYRYGLGLLVELNENGYVVESIYDYTANDGA